MTPLLKKFIQYQAFDFPTENTNLPLERILLWKNTLKDLGPDVYKNHDNIRVDVGYNWLRANLSDEEFAEFTAMKLRGQVT